MVGTMLMQDDIVMYLSMVTLGPQHVQCSPHVPAAHKMMHVLVCMIPWQDQCSCEYCCPSQLFIIWCIVESVQLCVCSSATGAQLHIRAAHETKQSMFFKAYISLPKHLMSNPGRLLLSLATCDLGPEPFGNVQP